MPEQESVVTRTSKNWFVTLRQFIQAAAITLLTITSAPASEPALATPLRVSFADLGSSPLELRGTQPSGTINIGVRGDEVVAAAKLRLRMTYSPALLPQLSHLRVSINDQVLAALPLPVEQAGREIEREVIIDPRYFSDFNQLRFELIGHYSMECEDPSHTSLWATLSPLSELELSLNRLALRNELGLLPAPFFDRRDNRRLVLPVVLPERPSREVVRSAGVAASWFGALADYRSARFPVSFAALPERHALVFATNSSKPGQLQLGDVTTPTVSVVEHPTLPTAKLLVFQGKDEAQLRQAVEGVVLGAPVLSGAQATVTTIERTKREPYDAPRWLRTHRPVKLGELVDAPQQLQTSGISPAPVRVNLRLPPDLFVWNQPGVPMNLRYRFTPPSQHDTSTLNVSINELLLRSYRLRPEGDDDGARKMLVPLQATSTAQQSEELRIPAFQLVSNNQLQFRFALDPQRQGPCSQVPGEQARQGIDPDSTIDFSDFDHYTAMPNLALFANAGYPFTRYADLSETAIVLPDTTQATALEQLFFLLGRMGRHTGAVALSYQLLNAEQAKQAGDADILILGGQGAAPLLTEWQRDLALAIDGDERRFRDLSVAPRFGTPLANEQQQRPSGARVQVNANGSLAAFISFQSPLTSHRTVVALAGNDDSAAQVLLATLEDDGRMPQIRGDLTIVRGDNVQSYRGESVYYVGSLSLGKRLWFHLSQHVVLFTLVTLAVVVVVAMLLYGGLQRRVARRLAANGSQ